MMHLLYLAAGNSRRFGENKLLAEAGGKPLFRWGLDTLADFCASHPGCELTVISRSRVILNTAREMGFRTVDSPRSREGLSFTIRAGIESLGPVGPGDWLLFAPADQPFFTEDTLNKLLAASRTDCEAAAVFFGDRPGSPNLFSASLVPELLALTRDSGGRRVLERHAANTAVIQAENPRELADVDLPEDLRALFPS